MKESAAESAALFVLQLFAFFSRSLNGAIIRPFTSARAFYTNEPNLLRTDSGTVENSQLLLTDVGAVGQSSRV